MNKYSLSSDSRRWWWPQAAAGAVGTAAVAAILVLPTVGHATPVDDNRRAPDLGSGDYSMVEPGAVPGRPCFIVQPRWNTALDGAVPVCDPPPNTAPQRHGVIRPWLD